MCYCAELKKFRCFTGAGVRKDLWIERDRNPFRKRHAMEIEIFRGGPTEVPGLIRGWTGWRCLG